ncbi:MAG: 2-oxoacid:ferredoxin oxidoreductase subunit beta [Candidatus Tectomicrobia bacterium]|nr:2-oxoacid:ferredoxin oxidoreductase subunit beta [Candidatus Tectomicrobia bacterium]
MSVVQDLTLSSYEGLVGPDWCPGCGDFGVLKSLKAAALELGIPPHEILIVSGIGCSSNLPGFMHAYGVHSLHGRSLPLASGAALANHGLHVVATGGDGDGYGIGIAHFIHAMRRNLNLTYIVMNNQIYGLTTGQASPTTAEGHKTKSTPRGNVERPINPIALALVTGATYVARAFSGNPSHMTKLIAGGIAHRGFSLVDVFSPCVTFNTVNTYPWFKKRLYTLEGEKGYDPGDFRAAIDRAFEWGERIPAGLFYRTERPIYDDSEPVLQQGPLVDQPLGLSREQFDKLLAETM